MHAPALDPPTSRSVCLIWQVATLAFVFDGCHRLRLRLRLRLRHRHRHRHRPCAADPYPIAMLMPPPSQLSLASW